MNILVTGATGYIGGKLVPVLLNEGHDVSLLVRDVRRLPNVEWVPRVAITVGDVTDPAALASAIEGADVAYYLVHSMRGAGDAFHQTDLHAGEVFGRVAAAKRVPIVFLGALGDADAGLTEHLRSRHETGQALAQNGADVTELRAGPVVGAGSLPFEMVRYLTERVPIMVCPRWVYTKVQPISLKDALAYLVASLDLFSRGHRVIEIGGCDVLSYGDMMTIYGRVRGLRRRMIRVPVLTPRLSSYWVHWFTPLKASFARPLVEGLRSEVIVKDDSAQRLFSTITPIGYPDAVHEALEDLRPSEVAQPIDPSVGYRHHQAQGIIEESRYREVSASPEAVFEAFSSLGGRSGWYLNWGWRLRGAIDRLCGGIGLRRGKPDRPLCEGDTVDFWRVEQIDPGRRLLLRAEMKLPGKAWLEFVSHPIAEGASIRQTSYFAPKGLLGFIYWYALLPVHRVVFDGLVRRVTELAEHASAPTAAEDR